jgi:cytidine deaminase
MTARNRKELLDAAKMAAVKAYSPYSRFRVGAAVQGTQGITSGCNVENASYGLTLCAERNALSSAVTSGNRKIKAIAVACIDAAPGTGLSELMPCGACRQWIQELAPDAEIIILGCERVFSISDLLPDPFSLKRR